MARPLRLQFPHAVYPVTSRGNARQKIVRGDADRTKVLLVLGRGARCSGGAALPTA